MHIKQLIRPILMAAGFLTSTAALHASEADLKIPPLDAVKFDGLFGVSGVTLMYFGILMCAIGVVFGLVQYQQTRALPVHKSMADVSQIICSSRANFSLSSGCSSAPAFFSISRCWKKKASVTSP